MSIIERTIKISAATLLAIFLANSFGLSYASSAGIIAILSVLETRKTSLKVAKRRFLSLILAFIISCFIFYFLGFSLISLGLYLMIYIPLAYFWGLESGIAPITVLVTHLLAEESIALPVLVNELSIFIIGAGVALIFNLYMPSRDEEIQAFHMRVEQQMKAILLRFEEFLLKGNGQNDATLIKELDGILEEALELVYHDRHNHLFHQTNYQVHYFEMRQQQNRLLRQMAININNCKLESRENALLAHLFHETARQFSERNPAVTLIDDINLMLETFRQRELPKTREEFETRAILFQLLQDLERLIQLKVDFYHTYKQD